jgi:hypothetical protein
MDSSTEGGGRETEACEAIILASRGVDEINEFRRTSIAATAGQARPPPGYSFGASQCRHAPSNFNA